MSSSSKPAPPHFSPVFWLFGLSGAGKSTLATALLADLRARGHPVLALDGDELRAGLCHGLGFSDADRTENLRRAAEVARLGAVSGLCVVASFITPLASHRQLVADVLRRQNLSLIHLDASLEICCVRDAKGLYTQAQQGKVPLMTGVSSSFEVPAAADLVLHTGAESPVASASRLLAFALTRLPMASA